jgi:hypothetical protein
MCIVVVFANFVSFIFAHCFCFDIWLNGEEVLPTKYCMTCIRKSIYHISMCHIILEQLGLLSQTKFIPKKIKNLFVVYLKFVDWC